MSRLKLGTQLASNQPATRCHWLQLARASYGYLNCLRSDRNGSKGNVGLLYEQNETSNIASQQLATMCHQLQLILVRYGYLSCFKSFNGVSRLFEVQRKLKGYFKVFTESFKGVSRKFKGCCNEVSRVVQGSVNGVSRKLQGNIKGV